jgi:hypothetical protein
MRDWEKTIQSEYANSPTICTLIQNMNEYIDPRADIDNFYNIVWNVETAVGFGLDIWGRIVGISRQLTIPGTSEYFGFNEGTGFYPFGQAPFYSGVPPATQTYTLSDDAYRTLILVKAMSNIFLSTAPAINQILQNLFSDSGRCYVNDLGGMKLRYTFEFLLTPYQFAIITQSGALPKPAAVECFMIQTVLPVFGFSEAGTATAAPFGQAPFISEGSLYAIS